MRISFVTGLQQDGFSFSHIAQATSGAGSGGAAGVGLDSTTTPSGIFVEATGAFTAPFPSRASGTFLGFHYAQALENMVGSPAITFYGDNGGTVIQSGFTGTLRM